MQTTRAVSFKLQSLTFLIFSAFFTPVLVNAQLTVTVAEDLDVLDPPPYPYRVGEPFKVNVDYSTVSLRRQRSSLQARIFRGGIEELVSHGGVSTTDGCRAYMTAIVEPYDYNGGIDFGFNFSESWLGVEEGGRLGPGRFVLVFELNGPREQVMMLRNGSIRAYFREGWEFEVQPATLMEAELVAKVVETMGTRTAEADSTLAHAAATSREDATLTEESGRCYQVAAGLDGARHLTRLVAVSCGEGSPASAP